MNSRTPPGRPKVPRKLPPKDPQRRLEGAKAVDRCWFSPAFGPLGGRSGPRGRQERTRGEKPASEVLILVAPPFSRALSLSLCFLTCGSRAVFVSIPACGEKGKRGQNGAKNGKENENEKPLVRSSLVCDVPKVAVAVAVAVAAAVAAVPARSRPEGDAPRGLGPRPPPPPSCAVVSGLAAILGKNTYWG